MEELTFRQVAACFLRERGWWQEQVDDSGRLYWRHARFERRVFEREKALWFELSYAFEEEGGIDGAVYDLLASQAELRKGDEAISWRSVRSGPPPRRPRRLKGGD